MWWARLGLVRVVLGCLAVWWLVAPSATARAQSCHELSLRSAPGPTLRVTATGLVASYANALYEGEYQGGVLGVRFAHPLFALDASLPGYRITRNGLEQRGLGDVRLGGRVSAYRRAQGENQELVLGPALDVTLPSGDPARGLGMGHVMLMPGVFVRVVEPAFTLEAQLAYGRALGMASGHAHGPAPIVQPMNRSELEHALALRVPLVVAWLGAFARLAGAIPVSDAHGAARESLGLGVDFVFSAFDVALEQELPLVGDPFRSRSLLRVAAQW